MKKIFLLLALISLLPIRALGTPPSGGGQGEIDPVGAIYCVGTQAGVYRGGLPATAAHSLETYGRVYLLPEPGAALLFSLALFFLHKKPNRSL